MSIHSPYSVCTPCPVLILTRSQLSKVSDIEPKTYLTTEDELEDPHDEHPGDAHQEGEDGGQEEAPPLSLPQTFLAVKLTKS